MSDGKNPHDSSDIRKDVRRYVAAGVALMVMMLITVGVSQLRLGPGGSYSSNVWPVLGLAFIQGGVVAALFMHLASEKWTIYRFMIMSAVFVAFMFFLTSLALHDRIHL